jgi:MFS family permease
MLIMARHQMLTGQSLSTFNRYLFFWAGSIFLLGALIGILSIPVDESRIALCLSTVTPGIDSWTERSEKKDVARGVWIYMTYSAPLVVLALILRVKKFHIKWPFFTTVLFFGLTYVVSYLFLLGDIPGIGFSADSLSYRQKIYANSSIGTLLYSVIFGLGFVSVWSLNLLFILEKFRRQAPKNH